jgi:hypothetical protein
MPTPTTQSYDFGSALLHFFKVFGRRPGGTLWVALWNGLLYIALISLVIWSLWPFYAQLITAAMEQREPEFEDVFAMMLSISGGVLLAMIGSIVVALMAQGAWLRLLARDEVAPMIPLRFGGDELRLLGVNVVLLILGSVLYMVAVGVVAGVVVAAAAMNESGGGASAVAGGLAGFALIVAFIALFVFLAIRFAPAPGLTVLDRKFRLFDAWPATRRIFWWALLTYVVMALMVMAMAMVLGSVAQMLFLPAIFPVIGEFASYTQTHAGDPSPDEALEMLWSGLTHPVAITFIALGTVVSLVLQTFYEGMWHSIGAYLARRHRGLEGAAGEPSAPAAPAPPPAPVAPAANTGDAGGDSGSSPH